jgi:lipoate-protein ligase A
MTESTPDTVIVCRPTDTCFCVGYHQDPEAELDIPFCRLGGYPVLLREIGGGAVVLDPNQLFYQVIVHASRAPVRVEEIYRTFLEAPLVTLRGLGLDARLEGTNEIEVSGRRIAGTGGGRIGDAMVLTGNLLFHFPYELMSRAWRVPSEDFRELAGKALRDSVTTLGRELALVPDIDAVAARLIRAFSETTRRPVDQGELTRAELAAVVEAEADLLAPRAEPLAIERPRGLKIARGIYVRQTEAGARLDRAGA